MILSKIKPYIGDIFLSFFPRKKIFTDNYKKRSWGNYPSASGSGSDLTQTKRISLALPKLLKKYKINSLLDSPCGDFYWLSRVNLPIQQYIGLDIVTQLISSNKKKYSQPRYKFITGDIISDKLPKSDMILCRDCLVHFSFSDIKQVIKNFKSSNASYLLTTTFPKHNNHNIPTGRWRPINLQKPPFNFPKPLEIISENCTENDGIYSDKSLALWRISDL